jgi:hypothetical protein
MNQFPSRPRVSHLGPFRIFSKIRGVFKNFATSFPSISDTGGKFASVVNDTGGNLPPVSMTPAANFPPVSLTPMAKNGKKYQAADTSR